MKVRTKAIMIILNNQILKIENNNIKICLIIKLQ